MKLKLKPDLHVAVQTDFVAKLLYLLVLHLVLASLRLPKRVLFLSYYSAFRDRLQGPPSRRRRNLLSPGVG
jgi:hypothetical protein